ncbi:MAG: hypothetical protein J5659_00205 [Clostridia bacterium]|nr:hypothetical protein [Clostridia bacterium]
MSTREILRRIARENKVSVAEVKRDMHEAIRLTMKSHPAESEPIWNRLAPDGKEPSIDEFIKFCAAEVTNRQMTDNI